MTRAADAPDHGRLAEIFQKAALAAGAAIMEVFDSNAGYREKADHSPVTVADERAEATICAALAEAFPEIPIVAEEAAAAGIVPERLGQRFFLVDPLDGTREFIARRRDFTVNIALIEDGVPTAGIVLAPALGAAYLACAQGAFRAPVDDCNAASLALAPIRVRKAGERCIAVASRSHRTAETDAFLQKLDIGECVSVGSSLKFCLIAEGKADIYPRLGRTMEWDTAAGDAVLRRAGGSTREMDGRALVYGKCGRGTGEDFVNPYFVARGG